MVLSILYSNHWVKPKCLPFVKKALALLFGHYLNGAPQYKSAAETLALISLMIF